MKMTLRNLLACRLHVLTVLCLLTFSYNTICAQKKKELYFADAQTHNHSTKT